MPLTPTLTTIRNRIALQIRTGMNPGTESDVKTVHVKRRFWRDYQKFRTLFQREAPDLLPGKVNGWMLTRASTREIEADERWRFYNIHRIEMMGYMAVQDTDVTADEIVFQDQVEAIRDLLRLDLTLFGNTEQTAPVSQVEQVIPVEIGGYTCWHARLSCEVEAIETKAVASP